MPPARPLAIHAGALGMDDREAARLRRRIADAIERLIDALDALSPDPDLEDGGDAEAVNEDGGDDPEAGY